MKRYLTVALLLPVLLLVHCGDRALVFTVDLLSFINPMLRSAPYGPISPGLPLTTVNLMAVDINLLEGLDDVTEVESAKIIVKADFVNETGSASARFLVFLNPAGTLNPFGGTPIIDVPVTVEPGTTTTISEEIPSTVELIELLTSDEAQYALRITFNTEGSSTFVGGVVTLTKLQAEITTKKDL